MKVELVESVKTILNSIIKKEDYKTPPEIEINQGSQKGDGYSSNTYSISIKSKDREDLNLFIKYLPDETLKEWKDMFEFIYKTEYKFYDEIYPNFEQFQRDKNIKEPFNNIPKFYKSQIKNIKIPSIILEDLKSKNYVLRDRKKVIDDDHLKLIIKTLARYHAISFAMRNQEEERFKKLVVDVKDIHAGNFKKFGMDVMIKKCVEQFIKSLDSILDKKMIERCLNLDEKLIDYCVKIYSTVEEDCVLAQGDCWNNNMMFLYDKNLPIDIKLIDWQCQRITSPLFDFSYFFYTLATKKELDNSQFYLNFYYEILSQRIIELGSDPEKVYPKKIFKNHWKKYALFGLCMAFGIIKAQLIEEDEVPNMLNNEEPFDAFTIILKNQNEYVKRMKDLVQYFINYDLI